MLTDYTPQQSRLDRAFDCGGSCCSVTCDACGRTYFVTSPGHGDYEAGELEGLRKRAASEPDKVIEVPDYSCVTAIVLGGRRVVIGCLCDPTEQYTAWIEAHAEELTAYLTLYWSSERDRAEQEMERATEAVESLATQTEEADDG